MAATLPPSPLFPRPRQEAPEKRQLSKEEVEEIRYAFDVLDAGRTGFVTPKQLKVALRALGFGVKKADVHDLLVRHGEDDKPHLDYTTFSKLVASKLQERSVADELRRAFQLFDVNGTGKIDAGSLRRIVRSLGLDIRDEELDGMVHEFDRDRDGMISEEEFMAIMAGSEDS